MYPPIQKSILISASPQQVWKYLTQPELMVKWMGEPELRIDVSGNWETGKAILIKGFHHGPFENKGTVMQCDPGRLLQYSQLSSISNLPDVPGNYSIHTFSLEPQEEQTVLTVHIEQFPTETIYKHLAFYWEVTPGIIKTSIEKNERL